MSSGSAISSRASVSYWGDGSATSISPSITNPRTTNNPKIKYQMPNSLKSMAGSASGL
jgi:hypothetical protein